MPTRGPIRQLLATGCKFIMRESWPRLGIGMFGLYLAAGAFYIPLMTLVSHSAEKGGFGFSRVGQSGVTLGIAVGFLLSLALIKRFERVFHSRALLLGGVVALQLLVTIGMFVLGGYLKQLNLSGSPISEGLALLFAAGVFSYATLSASSISLLHAIILESQWREVFSWFRVVGTIGYVIGGLLVGFCFPLYSLGPMLLAQGCLALVLVTILTSSHNEASQTPILEFPSEEIATGTRSLASLIQHTGAGLLLLVVCSAAVSRIYELNINVFLSEMKFIKYPSAVQMLGQSLEVVLLLAMPELARRFHYRGLMLLGPLAWFLLYTLLSISQAYSLMWVVFLGLPLQGFNCLFQTSAVVMIGQRASVEEKGVTQALLGAASGIGMLLGTLLSNSLVSLFRDPATLAAIDPQSLANDRTWLPIWSIATVLAGLLFFGTMVRARYGNS